MDITSEDLVNRNLYDYVHAEDLQKIRKSHCDREYSTYHHSATMSIFAQPSKV